MADPVPFEPLKFTQFDAFIEELLSYSTTSATFIFQLLMDLISTIKSAISIHTKRIVDYIARGATEMNFKSKS